MILLVFFIALMFISIHSVYSTCPILNVVTSVPEAHWELNDSGNWDAYIPAGVPKLIHVTMNVVPSLRTNPEAPKHAHKAISTLKVKVSLLHNKLQLSGLRTSAADESVSSLLGVIEEPDGKMGWHMNVPLLASDMGSIEFSFEAIAPLEQGDRLLIDTAYMCSLDGELIPRNNRTSLPIYGGSSEAKLEAERDVDVDMGDINVVVPVTVIVYHSRQSIVPAFDVVLVECLPQTMVLLEESILASSIEGESNFDIHSTQPIKECGGSAGFSVSFKQMDVSLNFVIVKYEAVIHRERGLHVGQGFYWTGKGSHISWLRKKEHGADQRVSSSVDWKRTIFRVPGALFVEAGLWKLNNSFVEDAVVNAGASLHGHRYVNNGTIGSIAKNEIVFLSARFRLPAATLREGEIRIHAGAMAGRVELLGNQFGRIRYGIDIAFSTKRKPNIVTSDEDGDGVTDSITAALHTVLVNSLGEGETDSEPNSDIVLVVGARLRPHKDNIPGSFITIEAELSWTAYGISDENDYLTEGRNIENASFNLEVAEPAIETYWHLLHTMSNADQGLWNIQLRILHGINSNHDAFNITIRLDREALSSVHIAYVPLSAHETLAPLLGNISEEVGGFIVQIPILEVGNMVAVEFIIHSDVVPSIDMVMLAGTYHGSAMPNIEDPSLASLSFLESQFSYKLQVDGIDDTTFSDDLEEISVREEL